MLNQILKSLSKILLRPRPACVSQSQIDKLGRDETPVYSMTPHESARKWSYSSQFSGNQVLTFEELFAIKRRSEIFKESILKDRDDMPIDDLSDIGIMCLVDVPRMIGALQFLPNVEVWHRLPGAPLRNRVKGCS